MELTTACSMDCPDACSLLVSLDKAGKVQRLRGNPRHPVTKGFTCSKIKRHLKRLASAERITEPLLRKGSRWQSIGWEAALDLCAEKIQGLRQEPAAILHIPGAGAKGVTKEAVRLFFDRLGSSRTRGSLCDAAGIMAYHYDFGSRRNHPLEDLLNARRIVNWGKDLSRSSVHMAAMVKKARTSGSRVLTISPGGDGNAAFSDEQIAIRPGTDRLLAAAALRRMVAQGDVGPTIVQHVAHWPAFRDLILGLDESDLMAACEVEDSAVERILEYYRGIGPTATIVGAGLQRYLYGGENVRYINALALLSGHIGRRGGGSYFHLHSLGLLNMEWSHARQPRPRRSLQKAVIGREILAARNPAIKMLWVNGTNVVNQAADTDATIRAFAKVDFKVVVDAFFNDTTRRGDLILPSALMLEQEDLIASFLHHFIHYLPVVVAPPGSARSDHWIIRQLGRRLTPPIELPSAEACMQASLQAPGIDITLAELRKHSFFHVSQPTVAYAGLKFDHPNGQARLPLDLHPEPPAPTQFPLRLLTLIRREAIHSQIPTDAQRGLPRVWLSPRCPALADLDLEQSVFLLSPLGRLQVDVALQEGLHPQVVLYRRGDWLACGGGANRLIAARPTDLGGGSAYYAQYVRIENGS
jgi:anaerobic selenocysteine-containing dehydrogenase